MSSDEHKPPVPSEHDPSAIQIHTGSDIQATVGYLPRSDTIDAAERIPIALEEGYDELAVELALAPAEASFFDKLRLIALIIVAAAAVIFLFPAERFFKPHTRDLGTMTIGDPAMDDNSTSEAHRSEPWFRVLLEIDRLYFEEGKLTDAIRVAESTLEIVPKKNWEDWEKIHYRYWELLSAAGKVHVLKTASQAYLQILPEDPFANYFYSHAFLTATNRIRSFTDEMNQAYRQEAQSNIRQIDSACNALNAQRKLQKANAQDDVLADLYQKLRLQQAKLYVLIWKLGNYAEDSHPDVVFRDKALYICGSSGIADLREAKELKLDIYTHILDQWWWFEGEQVIQGLKLKRKALEKEIKDLKKELKDVHKL
jgi:hypothetical protein